MIKKTITYTDYNGDKRTEDFFFHLTKKEVIDIEMGIPGGMANAIKDPHKLMTLIDTLITRGYGEKSPDGRQFMKSPDITKHFTETEAYDVMFINMMEDVDVAIEFFNALCPSITNK